MFPFSHFYHFIASSFVCQIMVMLDINSYSLFNQEAMLPRDFDIKAGYQGQYLLSFQTSYQAIMMKRNFD